MKPAHLVVAGLLLLLVPLALVLLRAVWLPLGLLLLVVGVSLFLVQKLHLDSRR